MDTNKLLEVGLEAQRDVVKTRTTERKCPFCNKKLIVEGNRISFRIKCGTKDCFVYTVRGL